MNSAQLKKLLKEVQAGKLSVPEAVDQLRTSPYEDIGFASIDHHRSLRQGFPEVIFCEGKTKTQVTDIARKLLKKGNPLLATRVTPEVARALKRLNRKAVYHEAARVVSVSDPQQLMAPFVLRPQVWYPPALMWAKASVGGLDWPSRSYPQHATLPSVSRPQVWYLPAATRMNTPAGASDRPLPCEPQHATARSVFTPQV